MTIEGKNSTLSLMALFRFGEKKCHIIGCGKKRERKG
jgi:hypothetical protein